MLNQASQQKSKESLCPFYTKTQPKTKVNKQLKFFFLFDKQSVNNNGFIGN